MPLRERGHLLGPLFPSRQRARKGPPSCEGRSGEGPLATETSCQSGRRGLHPRRECSQGEAFQPFPSLEGGRRAAPTMMPEEEWSGDFELLSQT
eukprot:9483817-Pyramimonas_sp.AAC.1